MDWTWYFIVITTISESLNSKVDEQGIANCVVELCKRIIPSGSTIFISLPIANYTLYSFGEENPFPVIVKKRTFNLEYSSFCWTNKSTISAFYVVKNPAYCPARDKIYVSNSLNYYQDYLLHYMHLLQRWCIVLSPTFYKGDHVNLLSTKFYYFILLITYEDNDVQNTLSELRKHLKLLMDSDTFNIFATFILVVTGEIWFSKLSDTIFSYLQMRYVYHIYLVVQTEEYISVYTWFPYRSPSGECGSFKESVLLFTYIGRSLITNDETPKADIFSNCTLSTRLLTREPFTILEKVSSKVSYVKDGLFPRLLKAIATHMKFSDKTCTIEFNKCDINIQDSLYWSDQSVTNFFTIESTFFLLHSERYPGWSSVLRVFDFTVWLSFVLSLLITGLFLIYLSRFFNDSDLYRSFVSSILNLWSVILGISVSEIPHSFPLRASFMSWVIFSLCINTVFQTYVTSYLIDPGFQHQIDTIEELKNLNYSIGICESTVYDYFADETEFMGQSYFFIRNSDCLLFSLLVPNSAVLISEEVFIYNIQRLCDTYDIPYYHKFSRIVLNLHAGLELFTSRDAHKTMNVLIARLVSAGIPDKLMRDVLYSNGMGLKVGLTFVDSEYAPISLEHMQSPFLAMFIGFLISIIVFGGEKLVYSVM
ncbi:Ionotropic receptor 784 [Blattella germanica]|nr:Ionotropic receptor 784 [Blattella germanica]